MGTTDGDSVEENFAKWFAERLRGALGDMSQAELLRILEQQGTPLTQQRLSHYMQGRNYPDPPVLRNLARALGVSADYLLGLTEQQLPVADIEEMLAQAKGEGRINRIMRQLDTARRQQVARFADYLLLQQTLAGNDSERAESERIVHEAAKWLASIERTRGLETRQKLEKIFRDQIFVNRAS